MRIARLESREKSLKKIANAARNGERIELVSNYQVNNSKEDGSEHLKLVGKKINKQLMITK